MRCPRLLRFPPEGHRGGARARATYELRASLLHEGELDVGHFRAQGNWQGTWWLCDDARVTPCGEEGLAEGSSAEEYGLFYARALTAGPGGEGPAAAPTIHDLSLG